MSYTMTIEPEIEREAKVYASYRGFSMEQFFVYCVEKECARMRQERTNRKKPNVSDFIGYGLKFDSRCTSTEEYMREMREGEI